MIWWRKARQGISVQTSILIVSHSVSQQVTEIWIQDCPCPPVCTSHSFSLAMKSRHSVCKYWKAPEECMQRTFLHPFLVTLEDEAIKCLRRLSLGLLGFPQAKRLLKKWISVTDITDLAEILLSELSHLPLACRATEGWKQCSFYGKCDTREE